MKKLELPKSISCLPLTDKELKSLAKKLNKKFKDLKVEQEVLEKSQRVTFEQLHTPMDI